MATTSVGNIKIQPPGATAIPGADYLIAWRNRPVRITFVNSHLKCKSGFVECFQWGEIVEFLSDAIVGPVRYVCKDVV
jgi:hypothetical protein